MSCWRESSCPGCLATCHSCRERERESRLLRCEELACWGPSILLVYLWCHGRVVSDFNLLPEWVYAVETSGISVGFHAFMGNRKNDSRNEVFRDVNFMDSSCDLPRKTTSDSRFLKTSWIFFLWFTQRKRTVNSREFSHDLHGWRLGQLPWVLLTIPSRQLVFTNHKFQGSAIPI